MEYSDEVVAKWNKTAQENRFCIESECPFYFGEIEQCMHGEDGSPTDVVRKCKEGTNK